MDPLLHHSTLRSELDVKQKSLLQMESVLVKQSNVCVCVCVCVWLKGLIPYHTLVFVVYSSVL
ncbi:hypothetical protein EXN66_Car010206 [Channa argus]|uniref:Uncharacterized protein n=1 Tax=Channa argus TaxID=215402 RepID=A0A6G1PW33_CHAAH|nr:hypothetical protein EXN66_Car010206 [Channa argus]